MDTGPFDLLLHGGRVICPASGIDGVMDIAVRGGKIATIQPSILPTSAKEVTDVSGQIVLPGLIDTHAHVYQYVTGRFGMNPDTVGVQSGVTTLVDQGGPSCMTLPGFRHFIAEPAQSRVLAFLSAYLVGGLEGFDSANRRLNVEFIRLEESQIRGGLNANEFGLGRDNSPRLPILESYIDP